MTSGNPDPPRRPGEFELIEMLFAPLAREAPGAFGLRDDAAVMGCEQGYELVLKTDSLIEGVHFRRDDPAGTVGRKALRRALSDLAAKGARPSAYLLALAVPPWPDMEWLEAFAAGLAADQAEFAIALLGGETNATPGPLTATVTAIGSVPQGGLIRRRGAVPGDHVFVTGTIGDAGAGLAVPKGSAGAHGSAECLLERYRIPRPRLAFGRAIRGIATASIDVSDGLLADLGHIADVSGVRIAIEAARIPLSDHLLALAGGGIDSRLRAATAGDDYEIAFTAAENAGEAIVAAARGSGTQASAIGRVTAGKGVVFRDESGAEIAVGRPGYTHF